MAPPPTLHLFRGLLGRGGWNRAKAEVGGAEGGVQTRGRGKRGAGRGDESGGGERRGPQPVQSSLQPPPQERDPLASLFAPHGPCPFSLQEGRSFLPWPAFSWSGSARACGNDPGPDHCCSLDLEWQSYQGFRRQGRLHICLISHLNWQWQSLGR